MPAFNTDKPFVLLVGVDFGDESTRALDVAANLARRSAPAVIHVAYVLTDLASPDAPEFAIEKLIDDARKELARIVAKSGLEQTAVPHVLIGNPVEALSEFAKDVHADVMVLGTHGRRGVSRLMFGSVAEAVTRRAPCSVLVVRERQLGADERIEPPCVECAARAKQTNGAEMFCARHGTHHQKAHTYYEASSPQEFGMGSLTFRTPGA